MADSIGRFGAFWPEYLRAHLDPRTRALHTSLALVLLLCFALTGDWLYLAGVPLAGYGFAWAAHVIFEKNRPATFEHPLLSFMGDFYMLYLWLTKRLAPELVRSTDRG
ncbi:MAG TPA: DUF962 domain-containing protein [Stellaceae bacterium]|nr:DUF962 domain-containing protein [Stellaceae bacterium]